MNFPVFKNVSHSRKNFASCKKISLKFWESDSNDDEVGSEGEGEWVGVLGARAEQ